MSFDLRRFYEFCAQLRIEAKESGLIKLDKPLGTQRYFMQQIADGLDHDVHFFVCLKGRQLGITTFSLALDLYWLFTHPGWQGTLVADTEENRDMFRSTLAMYMDGLPKEWRIPLVAHNRNQMVLKNRSRFFYQIAGNKSRLGQGKAITYLHGTETASWGNEEGLASLVASLAEKNAERLYVFESTAQGFNMFHDMYRTAKKAKTQRAIFIGWWRNELYSVAADSSIYKVYWDGRLKADEKEWVRDVKRLYNYEINSRQMAWWRWKLAEGIKDETLMLQEFPPTEDLAFILSGTSFFSHAMCTQHAKRAKDLQPDLYRYAFGALWQDTEVLRSTERLATLRVWQEPVDSAYYVIGADPAYGSSDWADRFCIQVFRVYADGMEQVAEFCTSDLNTYQFAWVIAHLAGAYRNSTLNLEVNGPGQAVINEIKNLRRQASATLGQTGRDLLNVLGSMQNYIWRRNDTLGGQSNSVGYITTASTKERMLNYMRDYFERNMLAITSMELLEEMKSIVREDGFLGAPGRQKDDRVIAAALAAVAYAEQVQPRLIAQRITREISQAQDDRSPEELSVGRNVSTYLRAIGLYGAK